MFHVLMRNPDPMGGGPPYQWITKFHFEKDAKTYVEKNKGPWQSYIITEQELEIA